MDQWKRTELQMLELWPASPPSLSGAEHQEMTEECEQMFSIILGEARGPGLAGPGLSLDGCYDG